MNSIAIIAFTRKGCLLARSIAEGMRRHGAYTAARVLLFGPERFVGEFGIAPYGELASWARVHFATDDALVFVGAAGIAVRAIAPHVRDKFTDPAVVSVDEAGRFAVPLLSGHVGGANGLARAVATIVGGQAAVSTATDVNGLFAVDEWATRHGMHLVERVIAKEISAALLSGEPVGVRSDFPLSWSDFPQNAGEAEESGKAADDVRARVSLADALGPMRFGSEDELRGPDHPPIERTQMIDPRATSASARERGTLPKGLTAGPADIGFVVSINDTVQPFKRTLHLVPRVVTVGVGCRRGTETAVLARAVDEALMAAGVSPYAVRTLASIDIKSNEPAIRELAKARGWSLAFYTAEQLAAVSGNFTASEFVRETVGVDNVCERSALAQGGELVLGKQSGSGTTVALAQATELD